ncbi:MAG: hypothetical protein ACRENP_09610 [Longimicrobiales bacterium]
MSAYRWKFLSALLAAGMGVGVAACDDGESTGLDVPNIAGTWTGAWVAGSATSVVQMQLQQSGETVTGSMRVGLETVSISGTINDVGEWRISTTTISSPQCSSYATIPNTNPLQLLQSGRRLEGPVRRTSCNDPQGFIRTLSVDKL